MAATAATDRRSLCRETLSGELHLANLRNMHSGWARPGPKIWVGLGGIKRIAPAQGGGKLSSGLLLCRFRLWLQAVQEVHGALRVGGGGKDRALVVLQNLEP